MGGTVVAMTTASASTAVASSAVSAGSSSSAWMMINQYQLLLTIPILETGLPKELLLFMEEFKLFTFSFPFLKGWSFGKVDKAVEDLNFEQPVKGIKTIGYESGSILVNEYNFSKVILTLVIANILFIILYFSLLKNYTRPWIKRTTLYFKNFFMLTVYIRVVIEAFYYILVCSLSEIVENVGNIQKPLSYTAAFFATIVTLLLPLAFIYHFCKYKNTENFGEEGKFNEIYDGFKKNTLSRLYFFIFSCRRVSSALIVVLLRTGPLALRLILFDLVQLASLGYVIKIRPFNNHLENFLEILNETIFFIFCIIVSILYKEKYWNSGITKSVLTMIMLNGLIIGAIMLVVSIRDIIIWFRKITCPKININFKRTTQIEVKPKENNPTNFKNSQEEEKTVEKFLNKVSDSLTMKKFSIKENEKSKNLISNELLAEEFKIKEGIEITPIFDTSSTILKPKHKPSSNNSFKNK